MKLALFVSAAASAGLTVNAFVPTHLDYLTDAELDEGMKLARDGYSIRRARFLQNDAKTEAISHRMLEDDVSDETAEIFESATSGEDMGDSIVFDPPIEYTQYASDTC